MFLGIPQVWGAIKSMVRHASGRLGAEEETFIPEMERAKVYLVARIWLAIHLPSSPSRSISGSILPMLLVGPLPTMYGAWVHVMTGLTQHGGLAEDVLDHRLNSRTVYMNPVLRFIYWNMNYHIEHHMFPMVPYHPLPELHEGFAALSAAAKFRHHRCLPRNHSGPVAAAHGAGLAHRARNCQQGHFASHSCGRSEGQKMSQWIEACATDDIDEEDVIRFDHAGQTFAIYRSPDDKFYATDGLCTHEKVHLADGLVMDNIIECPKHNGRFDYRTGAAKGAPACINLKTYPVKVEAGKVLIDTGCMR